MGWDANVFAFYACSLEELEEFLRTSFNPVFSLKTKNMRRVIRSTIMPIEFHYLMPSTIQGTRKLSHFSALWIILSPMHHHPHRQIWIELINNFFIYIFPIIVHVSLISSIKLRHPHTHLLCFRISRNAHPPHNLLCPIGEYVELHEHVKFFCGNQSAIYPLCGSIGSFIFNRERVDPWRELQAH